MDKPLEAISNVIELKPGHKYLLVFKNTRYKAEEIDYLQGLLREMGIDCLSIDIHKDEDLQVIEVPGEAMSGNEIKRLTDLVEQELSKRIRQQAYVRDDGVWTAGTGQREQKG